MASEECGRAEGEGPVDLNGPGPATFPQDASIWMFFTTGPRDPINHRRKATCNFCNASFSGGKPEVLKAHLLRKCQSIPADIKEKFQQVFEQNAACPTPEKTIKPPKKRQKLEEPAQRPTPVLIEATSLQSEPKPLTQTAVELLYQSQLHFFIMCNIPFATADTVCFQEFVQRLQPAFSPAGTL
jgi:BED zinc finger